MLAKMSSILTLLFLIALGTTACAQGFVPQPEAIPQPPQEEHMVPIVPPTRVPCANNGKRLVQGIAERYSEKTLSMGLTSNDRVIKILLNPKTRSWSIIEIHPSGAGCLISHGTNMELLPIQGASL